MLGEPASILRQRPDCQAALDRQLTQKGRRMAAFWMVPPGNRRPDLVRLGSRAPRRFR
jgi:hypothetical protein